MPYVRLDATATLTDADEEHLHGLLWNCLQEVYGVNKAIMEKYNFPKQDNVMVEL